jgi:hypothetical protein
MSRFTHRPLLNRDRARWLSRLIVAILSVLGLASPAVGSADKSDQWGNAFLLNRMLAFHVVNDTGLGFTCSFTWTSGWQAQADTPILVRVFGPQEQEITRHLEPGLRVTGTPPQNSFDLAVGPAGVGVYQVIVTSGLSASLTFTVTPELRWGVYGSPELRASETELDAYVYLPPNLPSLSVQVWGTVGYVRLTDPDGVVHMNMTGTNPAGATALPTGGPPAVWRLTSAAADSFGLNFGYAPIILCPDEATALAIHSSVDVLEDGTICYHKFQIDAHAALEQYRALDASAFEVTPPPFTEHATAWVSEPARNSLLIGPGGVYSALLPTLQEQNLDPASPWFGAIYRWHDVNGVEFTNPWITYHRNGLVQASPTIGVLAAVYAIDAPFNPLHHDDNLRNRIVIAALQDIMMLREYELPETMNSTYDGGDKAFHFAIFTRWLPWVFNDLPGTVRIPILEGMRRYVDHMALSSISNVGNQWSFIMLGIQNFASAVGEQFYRDAVDRHIEWLLTRRNFDFGAMPAGYISEGSGPDTTYSGIVLHNLAWLAEQSGHAQLKQALGQCYRLLNHTLAPEPDGSWMGATSFAHRTSDPWSIPQWGGGVAMMGDDSPHAGVMVGRTWIPWPLPRNAAQLQQAQQNLANILQYQPSNAYDDPNIGVTTMQYATLIQMPAWEHFLSKPLTGQLPMKASDRFTRKMGDEFLCVRRPSYYALLYCGRTMEDWLEASKPTSPEIQYPRNGGGLSMFWSPRFGSSVLAQNWSACASNSVIAARAGQTFFEDYWSVTSGLQESLSRATVNGRISDDNLAFRRQMNFLEDRVQCELRLQSQAARNYDDLWESFPYPLNKPDAITVTLHDENGAAIPGNDHVASAIVFRNSTNEVHIIAFKNPRRCEFGTASSTDSHGVARETGRVLTSLPKQWTAGQARVLKWSMKAVRPNQVQQTIRQMIQAM